MLTIDLSDVKAELVAAIQNALPKAEKVEYADFADAKHEFPRICGISFADLEKKVYSHQEFKQYIRRFEGSNKRYIEVEPARVFVRNLMIKECDR
ncbi:hypothetical protein LAU42_07325 [Macrococcus armenti]|uniref:hypothetical protein n=1 Tax=Macrococcus armenti TaxID=2875764 RepID=UPI001CC9E266|nr:hypothetical protein [Macrococcus armenti]UBH21607.1 hypothetical protein LAU42_07325 [Macrococcus armenti]